MNNLSAHDFNDLQGLCPEEFEVPDACGVERADLFGADHGIQNPITITDSKTVVIIPATRVDASDINAFQKQDIITTTEFLISNDVTESKASVMLSYKHHEHFVMASKTVRSGRIHATLFNRESTEMHWAGLRHQEHQQGSDSIAMTSAGC